jgi:uncharacterized protein YhaN
LEETAQELSDQLGAALERQKVLSLTRQVIDESRTVTMISAKDVLEERVGTLVREITRGRYSEVHVSPSDLKFRLMSPDKGEPVDVVLGGELSTGTVEQVYLAARFALAGLLASGKRPPLILDDPFVTFDPSRTKAVFALCKRLSAETQVLLFTCHPGYESMADNVIRLPSLIT